MKDTETARVAKLERMAKALPPVAREKLTALMLEMILGQKERGGDGMPEDVLKAQCEKHGVRYYPPEGRGDPLEGTGRRE